MEATSGSIDREMSKEDTARVYSGILLSHRKKRDRVIGEVSMDLESAIQNRV